MNGYTLAGAQSTAATEASEPGCYAIPQGALAATANSVVTDTGSTLSVTAKPTRSTVRDYGGAAAATVTRDHALSLPTLDGDAPVAPPPLRLCPSKRVCGPARP